jgi:RHS repeat-associated protein
LQVGQLVYPYGDYAQNYYDVNARLTSTALENSAGVLDSHAYSNNVGNQRVQQTLLAGNYENYAYDKIGQLTNAVGKELGGTTNRLQEQLSYAYDAAHNLSNRTENALVQTFGVNNLNELSTATHSGTLTVAGDTSLPATNVTINGTPAILYRDNAFAKDGFGVTNGNNSFTAIAASPSSQMDTNTASVNLAATASYAYDGNGNLLSDGLRTFSYDDENELTSIVVSNSVASTLTSNIYDGKLRLRIRKEYIWSSGWIPTNEVHYIYDGNLVIQERSSNNVPGITYTRGRDLSGSLQGAGGIGGLLPRTDNSLTNGSPAVAAHGYYFSDGNGNITLLTGYDQGILARYTYDPFGHVLAQSGPLAMSNVYQFSSKEFHRLSGLVYYLYRWYDPYLQRWPNRDPLGDIEFEAIWTSLSTQIRQLLPPSETFMGPNLYSFVSDDPITGIDPFGLSGMTTGKGLGHGKPCKVDCASAETDCNIAVVIGVGIWSMNPIVASCPVCIAAATAAGMKWCHKMEQQCEASVIRLTSGWVVERG